MDEQMARRIQQEGADALLDIGVSIPLKEVHLPFARKPLRLRVTMKRPCMSGQIEIARTYLSMGVTSDELRKMTLEGQMQFLVEHGNKISKMIALTICRGWLRRKLFVGLTAWFVRNFVEHRYQMGAMATFMRLMGTESFTNIIRSAERANPLTVRLSQKRKGS